MTPTEKFRKLKLDQIQRKLEGAQRARRLALEFSSNEDRERALEFAKELEAQAGQLERELAEAPIPKVDQVQVQLQQGPPLKDNEEQGPK